VTDPAFADLIERVRGGDQDAAFELVRRYEPRIRRFVHGRMNDAQLRRVLDSQDIVQSALGEFFRRLNIGQFDLEKPEDLAKLLTVMARNKLRNKAKAEHREKRGGDSKGLYDNELLSALADSDSSPSHTAIQADLMDKVVDELSPAEREIFVKLRQGFKWEEIAATLGDGATSENLRQRWSRTLQRLRQKFDSND
jgi:RNA polymerase sigma-70 factor (ECF subfamily)